VTINTYRVIYNLIDDVKAAMEGKLRQVEERVPMGSAKVKAVFGTGKKRVAGCEVLEGKLVKGCQVEVKRGKDIVYKGTLASLRCGAWAAPAWGRLRRVAVSS
jgi:translation initiation factor IF-2